MCGIAGIYNRSENVSHDLLKEMCDRLQARGPDAEGFFFEDRLGLGHRRLSIIDLETGDQPMYSSDGSVVVVFNGEIYNFRELKEELLNSGFKFKTRSDTEVLINGYLAYGIETILDRIEGMFAFSLYDRTKQLLYLARDKFGEKPLYYYIDENRLWFASELKAFNPDLKKFSIDKKALNYFLALTYIPAPYTIYNEIRKLEAGSYIVIDKDLTLKRNKYFELDRYLSKLDHITDFTEAVTNIKKLITDSVRQRMVSDVPLGVFLSGGIDSSIIASVMSSLSDNPVKTFTIGFREKTYDESRRAEIVADHLGAEHTVQFIDYPDVVSMIDEIVLNYDEPYGDSSAIPSYYVAKLAREKVKIVLTGDCGDETFGGYEKYLIHYYAQRYNRLPVLIKSLVKKIVLKMPHNRLTDVYLRKLKKVILNSGVSDFEMYYNLMSLGFNDKEREELFCDGLYTDIRSEIENVYNSVPGSTALEKSQYTDMKIVLEGDMFVKTDRVTMKCSLETRAPFIDTRIVSGVFSIPSDFKIKGSRKKYILREAFRDYLPPETLKYSKMGFGVPVDYWLRNELKDKIGKLLNPEFIERQGLFNPLFLNHLLEEHQLGKANHKGKLWNLYVFQIWYLAHTK